KLSLARARSSCRYGVAGGASATDQVTLRRAEASMPYQATSAMALPAANPSHTPPGTGRSSHAAPARQPGRIRKLKISSPRPHGGRLAAGLIHLLVPHAGSQ